MSLYDDIMELLSKRKVVNYEVLSPLYACSLGCHMINIWNKKRKIILEGELISDLRLHVIMVTVPGFGKSYLLKQFLEDSVGITAKTKIKPKFLGSITTASLVGTVRSDKEGNAIINKGIADIYKDSILGIHEFAELTTSMKQNYNLGLLDALLQILDDGHVVKDVASGGLDYYTFLTLFTAVQPMRYDLTSGIGRRICFLVYVPTYGDIEKFRTVRRQAKRIVSNKDLLDRIHSDIDKKFVAVEGITGVEYAKDFYDWMDKKNIIPYEEILYERIAIGYWVMKNNELKGILHIKLDKELIGIMERQWIDRGLIKRGVDKAQIWKVIEHEKVIDKEKLFNLLLEFSIDERVIRSKLKTLIAMNYIREDNNNYYIVDRKGK